MVAQRKAASILIGPGARDHLHLSATAGRFRIYRRHNYFDFLNHVGTGVDRRPRTIFIPAVVDVNAVARRIDIPEAPASHVAERSASITLDSGHVLYKVKHIARQ